MRFNPCGAAVEMLRRGYTTTVRPFRDSPIEVPIRWYRALPDAPTLPYPSVISSLDWMTDPWTKEGVGEVYGKPRVFDPGRPIPGATGRHQCGTREDFAGGGVYDDQSPPVVYAADGLPVCCSQDVARRSSGGTVTGGTARVRVVPPAGYCPVYSVWGLRPGQWVVLTRTAPDENFWFSNFPIPDLQLTAVFGDDSWTLYERFTFFTWYPAGAWNGQGQREFFSNQTGPVLVRCGLPP